MAKHIYDVAQSVQLVWKKFDIETVSLGAIRSKISYFVNKYKKQNKKGKRKTVKSLNYNKVIDFKDPKFSFLTKEDELLYQQQLTNRSGYTTEEKVKYTPHPSKIRKFDQMAQFQFTRDMDLDSNDSGDSEYEPENSSTPLKTVYNKASTVGYAVNKTQISYRKANKFLATIDSQSLEHIAPSISVIYKVNHFLLNSRVLPFL